MARIIAFGEFENKRKQKQFENNLQKKVEEIEEELGIEDPLLVLTDDIAITLGDKLLDIREEINSVLDILGIDEVDHVEGLET